MCYICCCRRRRKSTIPRYGAANQYPAERSYSAGNTLQGATPECKQFQNEAQFYSGNDNRYYPTWHCHENSVPQRGVTTGNAMPPTSFTEPGVLDQERKASTPRFSEHIYESPQFERRDHSFLPRESLDQTKYFELDPKVAPPVNNNGSQLGPEKEVSGGPKAMGMCNRYST